MTDRYHLAVGIIVSLLVAGLAVSPAFRHPDEDSFPLSTFPMFSRAKPDPGLIVTQALAVFADGTKTPLPPKLATGNEEVIQALRMIRDEVYGGRKRAGAFCRDIVRRLNRANDPEWADVIAVEIARTHFDTVEYFEEGPAPVTRKTLKRCKAAP